MRLHSKNTNYTLDHLEWVIPLKYKDNDQNETDILKEMEAYFGDDKSLVDHTLEVLRYAKQIMDEEKISDDKTRSIIIEAAVLHDIGVIEARRKHGSSDGRYQEKEGPEVAKQIMEKLGRSEAQINRVYFIVGHHHTPSAIDGIDFQIVWEADQIVNVKAGGMKESKENFEKYFKTKAGNCLLKAILEKS